MTTTKPKALGSNTLGVPQQDRQISGMNAIDMDISTLHNTAASIVAISNDLVAAILTLLKLHFCDCCFIGNCVLLAKL